MWCVGVLSLLWQQVPDGVLDGYAAVLRERVADGLVAYKRMDNEDLGRLDAFLRAAKTASISSDRDATLAFLIDTYNALVIRAVIDVGRPRSVLDVKGFFETRTAVVAGRAVTLDALEKEMIRDVAKGDPRFHMVLVCGAVGCPKLERRPFMKSDLEARFFEASRRYLSSAWGAQVHGDRLMVSRIFDWYKNDFGGDAGVAKFLAEYLPPEKARVLRASGKWGYLDYDWSLNQQ